MSFIGNLPIDKMCPSPLCFFYFPAGEVMLNQRETQFPEPLLWMLGLGASQMSVKLADPNRVSWFSAKIATS